MERIICENRWNAFPETGVTDEPTFTWDEIREKLTLFGVPDDRIRERMAQAVDYGVANVEHHDGSGITVTYQIATATGWGVAGKWTIRELT